MKDYKKGFVHHCIVQLRKDHAFFNSVGNAKDSTLFREDEEGKIIASLDGYAIIPLEEYYRLKGVTLGAERRN